MKNTLILGGSGFLGRNIIKYLNKYFDVNIFVVVHSEHRISIVKKNININIKNIKIIDISNHNEWSKIEDIIVINNIDTIINCAAMKHVDLCEVNIAKTLYTNVLFCDYLTDISLKHKINNVIGVSTDKANDPINIYGMSKYMMEKIFINKNYKIFKGVNFLWSDGSVLNIWYNQFITKKPLTFTNLNSIRFYNTIDTVCETIINGIKNDKQIITTEIVYKIALKDLLSGFMKYFNYYNSKQIDVNSYEKICEKLYVMPDDNIEIVELCDDDDIYQLIDAAYKLIDL